MTENKDVLVLSILIVLKIKNAGIFKGIKELITPRPLTLAKYQ